MNHFWKDLGRGLLYAIPVLAVAALGAREVIRLRASFHESEAQRLAAERALARAEEQLATALRQDDLAWEVRRRAVADAAEAQGATEERLNRVVEFLKQEVTSAESTIEALRRGEGVPQPEVGRGSPPASTTADLIREISRLNAEIEILRGSKAPGR